ncbi:hypothetical protein H8Z72_22910 (plasmid) [Xanthomonas citri pv. citri]|uniref:hypothetical protein n=1 Tax=Xanthomonas citri TaxID=346 RepID=UPI0019343132|nr:hypothetical protein [Xanthomonas citri]QRD62618.1 hypothetical protein H8Z74_23275 [Xanthomonas citri pv. citri]QRD67152.1 hypothetical protein H8Z73_22250 [Xanthomonas citri pv. citri]QRD71802.1 hypothetical protein H8Z72_22910 [Xanthomonas citri pv. citri]
MMITTMHVGSATLQFCPLAKDVGNAADWASVVVSLVLGLAVFQLSRAANATARRAKEISEQEATARRDAAGREGRLLLIHLENELLQAERARQSIANWLGVSFEVGFVSNRQMRLQLAASLRDLTLSRSEQVFARLHVLDDQDAQDIARLISGLARLQHTSEEAAGIDLSQSMPGAEGEAWNEWRRGLLSEHYGSLSSGLDVMGGLLDRLIARASQAKLDTGATANAAG